jgi:phosphoglycerol transferase MdoB-like AlkP superfamily enzyme
MIHKIPKFIKLILYILLFNLFILTIYRVGFYVSFSHQPFSLDSFYAFILGFRFDLQFLAISILPLLFFGKTKYVDIFNNKIARKFWLFYLVFLNTTSTILHISDYFHYEHFGKKLDATVIRFLYDFGDASTMFIEGYPIFKIAIAITLLTIIPYIFYKKLISNLECKKDYEHKKTIKIIIFVSFVVLIILAGYGRIAMFPLRWSDAFRFQNSFLAHSASSPVVYFINTLKNRDIKYNKKAVQKYYDTVADYLQIEPKHRDKNRLSFARPIKAKITKINKNIDKPNIIFVLSESSAYMRTGLSKNPLNATPNFDRLAKEGMLFKNFYVPTGTTAKSVFASLTSIADVETTKSTTRNPLCVKQNILVNFLEGYSKSYFIGGSTSWGNIRGLLSNIKDIKIYEEDAYTHSRNDVWGISDVDLIVEANEVYKKAKKPFFSYFQTSGNHSPFTIPKNRYGFKIVDNIDKKLLNRYGFDDIKQYNACRFMDFTLNMLIEKAKKEKYFKNTIFIIIGDHGLNRHYEHITKIETNHLTVFHVPLLIYAPHLIKPKVIDNVVSELDIMPTIASLTKSKYINSAFGFDITSDDLDGQPDYRISMSFGVKIRLQLTGSKYIFNINSDGSDKTLIDIKSPTPLKNIKNKKPKLVKKLSDTALGLYESMVYTRYFNSDKDIKK